MNTVSAMLSHHARREARSSQDCHDSAVASSSSSGAAALWFGFWLGALWLVLLAPVLDHALSIFVPNHLALVALGRQLLRGWIFFVLVLELLLLLLVLPQGSQERRL